MTTVDYFPIQDLPTELEREIFETAAYMRPSSALDLVLVARKVRTWIQPLIYEMVTLGTDDTSLFLRTMDELPVAFFQQNVKRLCLTVSVEPEAAARILATCSGLQSLACWVDFRAVRSQIHFSPLIASQRLQRLSMEIRHFQQLCRDPLCQGALFRSLTRLDLIYWEPGGLDVLGISGPTTFDAPLHNYSRSPRHGGISSFCHFYVPVAQCHGGPYRRGGRSGTYTGLENCLVAISCYGVRLGSTVPRAGGYVV
ncbi:hypothetical protein EDD18DRAFT_348513 [Armillaria luteobubalina]|uniref:Uncharacterized protein n=1 Tax=Armillaria luteobubalina TaxID=153913 RepID=A0AA39UMQ9_9AGAR|nr:hypothetical protein EDD18DRAFT_348513 [Armillaria luteobubalina]